MTIATGGPARHADKIEAAIVQLRDAGELRHWHRDAAVQRRAEARLVALGCLPSELPSRSTWRRTLPGLRPLWRTPS